MSPKIKGIHNAMKSGMVAAESLFPLLQQIARRMNALIILRNLKTVGYGKIYIKSAIFVLHFAGDYGQACLCCH